jgi:pantetheine-phosphate adenylyltransferase
MNRELDPNYETVFLMSSPSYSFVSSRMIKEIVKLGGDVSPFVPPAIVEALKRKNKHG